MKQVLLVLEIIAAAIAIYEKATANDGKNA
jgi:hypothetical protein